MCLNQVCYQRKWPLISADYRLLPQAGSDGLMQDVKAAYEFALNWDVSEGKQQRRVMVGGSSAGKTFTCLKPGLRDPGTILTVFVQGAFLPMVAAHHLQPAPLAVLSLEGVSTFRHPFFNSSTLLVPESFRDEDVADLLAGPVSVGETPEHDDSHFDTRKLGPDGSKNPDFRAPPAPAQPAEKTGKHSQEELYDYFLSKNQYLALVGDIDPGFEWARDPAQAARRDAWPATVVIHSTADVDVPIGVSEVMVDGLGRDKVELLVVEGQGHLFTQDKFWEDEAPEMEVVRRAVARLDAVAAGE